MTVGIMVFVSGVTLPCVRRDRALCKADRPNADDTIHTVETVERKCITDGLVGDNETRCEGHLVEIYRP